MTEMATAPTPELRAAGTHLLVDLIGASRLDDPALIEQVLRECVRATKASLLYIYVHHFGGAGGVTGVAVLAESHISIHSWPEHDFAAVDVFTCGTTDPEMAIPVLEANFRPKRVTVQWLKRGRAAFAAANQFAPITAETTSQ
ncbi:S-adenosylmethionine decarboxylase [Nocardia tenerifensis]|uniref:S-adenosylmethionine decarboxylase proenzyme n=1 Tax=Nocardia tenerifensis TaxID=228006 RepID=A0A318JWT2_9NOCA|nr:adenosylmethionine decarboxylase [Nocardia tenerifensis]PXX61079.1 S-adenosylmethionine decarboxylase [Nocardia tenerifensis]